MTSLTSIAFIFAAQNLTFHSNRRPGVRKRRWIACEEKKRSLGERLSYCFEVLHRRTSQEPDFRRTDHGPCSAASIVR
jgi:hypothetical protein